MKYTGYRESEAERKERLEKAREELNTLAIKELVRLKAGLLPVPTYPNTVYNDL